MVIVVDLVWAVLLRSEALVRAQHLRLVVAAGLVLGVNLLAASSVVLTSGLPPLGWMLFVALLRWVGLSAATSFVIGSFYRARVSLRTVLNLVAVAHVGLTAALLPIPAAFQIAAGLAWSAAIAVKGLALAVEIDARTAGASLALGFLAMLLLITTLPLPVLALS
jgi:hypothetical protein